MVHQHDHPSNISEDERALLYLCMRDLRDHQIGARLFISVRTVQRRLERLMTLAEAESRFGLGARATRLGWIAPEPALTVVDASRRLAG